MSSDWVTFSSDRRARRRRPSNAGFESLLCDLFPRLSTGPRRSALGGLGLPLTPDGRDVCPSSNARRSAWPIEPQLRQRSSRRTPGLYWGGARYSCRFSARQRRRRKPGEVGRVPARPDPVQLVPQARRPSTTSGHPLWAELTSVPRTAGYAKSQPPLPRKRYGLLLGVLGPDG